MRALIIIVLIYALAVETTTASQESRRKAYQEIEDLLYFCKILLLAKHDKPKAVLLKRLWRPPLLAGTTWVDTIKFCDIIMNDTATRKDLNESLTSWADEQSADTIKKVDVLNEAILAMRADVINYLTVASTDLSQVAQDAIYKMIRIIENDNLTLNEEIRQVEKVLDSQLPNVSAELQVVFGALQPVKPKQRFDVDKTFARNRPFTSWTNLIQ